MAGFIWQGDKEIVAHADLRARGWILLERNPIDLAGRPSPGAVILADGSHRVSLNWRTPAGRATTHREFQRWVLLIGIGNPRERAALLRAGLGDVLGNDFTLDELNARARRVMAMATMLPRARSHGPLHLELLARDGYVDGKRLGLHPREFALAWRLMETPGCPVDKSTLLRDVWQLDYTPETNSLAVHARRLRAKLEIAGLPGLIRTTPGGGYCLADAMAAPESGPAGGHGQHTFMLEPNVPGPTPEEITIRPLFSQA